MCKLIAVLFISFDFSYPTPKLSLLQKFASKAGQLTCRQLFVYKLRLRLDLHIVWRNKPHYTFDIFNPSEYYIMNKNQCWIFQFFLLKTKTKKECGIYGIFFLQQKKLLKKKISNEKKNVFSL